VAKLRMIFDLDDTLYPEREFALCGGQRALQAVAIGRVIAAELDLCAAADGEGGLLQPEARLPDAAGQAQA
jgi:hypothetical protein